MYFIEEKARWNNENDNTGRKPSIRENFYQC